MTTVTAEYHSALTLPGLGYHPGPFDPDQQLAQLVVHNQAVKLIAP